MHYFSFNYNFYSILFLINVSIIAFILLFVIRHFKEDFSSAADRHLIFVERSKGTFFSLLSPSGSSFSSSVSASLSSHWFSLSLPAEGWGSIFLRPMLLKLCHLLGCLKCMFWSASLAVWHVNARHFVQSCCMDNFWCTPQALKYRQIEADSLLDFWLHTKPDEESYISKTHEHKSCFGNESVPDFLFFLAVSRPYFYCCCDCLYIIDDCRFEITCCSISLSCAFICLFFCISAQQSQNHEIKQSLQSLFLILY